MSKYTPTFTVSTEFEEDTVNVTMNRLKRKHLMQISKYVSVDDKGETVMKGDQSEIMAAMSSVLSECVVGMHGLKDSLGHEINLETVLEEVYFMPLVTWMTSELMNASNLGEDDIKK